MLNNLLKNAKITRVSNDGAGTASATPTKGTILDMQGFESVMFIAAMADVVSGSVVALRAAQGATNDTAEMDLLTGSSGGTAGASDVDNKLVILDVVRPTERYIEVQLFHTTQNAPFDGIIAIQYGARNAPVTQGSTVYDADTLASPAEA